MIAYFDTSALVPLVIEEPTSPAARRMWAEATRVLSARISYAEARAGLALAARVGRITDAQLRPAVNRLRSLIDEIDHLEVTATLVHAAGELAESEALKGYDAVHLAAAHMSADGDTVVVTGDRDLARAAGRSGLAVGDLR